MQRGLSVEQAAGSRIAVLVVATVFSVTTVITIARIWRLLSWKKAMR